MSPFVRKQLRQCKRSQLSIAGALIFCQQVDTTLGNQTSYKSNQGARNNHCRVVLGRSSSDEADEHQDVSKDDEPAAAEEIRVGTTNPTQAIKDGTLPGGAWLNLHESHCNCHGVNGNIPSSFGTVSKLAGNLSLKSAQRRNNPERDTVGEGKDLYVEH